MSARVMMAGGAAGLGALAVYYSQNAGVQAPAGLKNSAFVFIKPHAVTDKVQATVRSGLEERGIKVLEEGHLASEVIDEKKLIDQHYYAIASKATILKPEQLNVPKDKFQAKFGLDWDEALKKGVVFNAMDACKELGCDAAKLNQLWGDCKKNGNLVKFGGGFYCGKISQGGVFGGGKTIYVFNGFFMSMRSNFTAPGRSIHWYSVEWDPAQLSWADFRGKVLGPTDPKEAPEDSLRGRVLKEWKSLGLASEPNVGDNAVHASASPFEGLAERMNWLQVPCKKDDFCQAMVSAGVSESTIEQWSVDPQVNYGGGKKGSLFDALEDLDARECIQKSVSLNGLQ
eukprot:TRINITY_DN294_c0_g3_i1.p2 TRINITY_DN294_c0_g3~~TRINITY_DN294_c0_g3_i1.p2  ORF type:complete len:342 (+),score=161.33 TRINITY_DN294_c0_g3_i1:67-1092(+)